MDGIFWWPVEENLQNLTSNAAPTKTGPISSVGPVPEPKSATHSPVQISSVGPRSSCSCHWLSSSGKWWSNPFVFISTHHCDYKGLDWSTKGLLLFFWALLIPNTDNFLPPAPSLTLPTPSPLWSSSRWCRQAHHPPSPPQQTSRASGTSRQILQLFLSLLCICLSCRTTAHSINCKVDSAGDDILGN